MVNVRKCAIIGCGFVGAASAFSLMQSGLFSELVLIDANRDKAEGEAMDLSHGAPFARPIEISAGAYDDIADCGLIVVTAGANQKPGETRLDLVNKNVGIFKQIIPEIKKRQCEGILLVVSNPVDILTYTALKLSGFPPSRVIGSGTVLDTARLKYLLGQRLGVDSRSVHAYIIGEHGDSELAVWSSANVSGVELYRFCELCGHFEHEQNMQKLYEDVRDSAYEIIQKKGATYYGIAMAVRRIAECIMRDERSILPVSSLIEGYYGLNGICMGIPTIVGSEGVEKVVDVGLSGDEQLKLLKSAESLKKVLDTLDLS
ncbi:L-lactate dehydrogenase [Caprobacter fermentans]|uniref:L-lactate dehydrogenase n=1 Tax=Caproicibacter fermentans TaxID=2576756 RepID=A0A6N8HVL7_9FIRM|nr:L-lactate dehydrogenase [Caproicibacter fermentans]MVB09836.1 L-lactate dehydrogenase [Caproicibacter fermentans]OCN02040.1 L-lactate dehydrogenase [Clostridium sp. W14A]QNK42287.1 L-lactate dehydrogenase [Caproicibacter fermentans]